MLAEGKKMYKNHSVLSTAQLFMYSIHILNNMFDAKHNNGQPDLQQCQEVNEMQPQGNALSNWGGKGGYDNYTRMTGVRL